MPEDNVKVSVTAILAKRMADTKVMTGQYNANPIKRFEVHFYCNTQEDWDSLSKLEQFCLGQEMVLGGPVKLAPPPPRQEDEE
jgi:hypothetical protein